MDIRGILGMDSDVRNGYDDIKVTFKIDSDAPNVAHASSAVKLKNGAIQRSMACVI